MLLQPVLTSSSELKLPQYIQPLDTGTGQFSFTSGWLTNPNQHAYAGYLVQCNQNLSALNLTLSIEESSQGGLEHFLSVSAADSDLIVFPQSSVPLSGAVAITVHSKSASTVFTLKETQDETPETQKVASE